MTTNWHFNCCHKPSQTCNENF